MKKCNQCKRMLDEQEFIKDDKDHKICNRCRDYSSKYYKKEREIHPERSKNRQKKYRNNNLEKVRERDRIAHKKYRDENPEEYKKSRLAYQEKNKEKSKNRDKNRMEDRPEYFLFSAARGRARKYKVDFTITEQDVKELIEQALFCPLREVKFERGKNRRASPNSISIDRINASRGYTKDNIQIISYKANLIKNSANFQTFEKIVHNLKYVFQEKHNTDDITRSTIINDRLLQFSEGHWTERDRYRILNVERWLIASAKKRAKRNNLEINIDTDYIKSIWPLDNKCPILEEKFVSGKGIMSKNSATIDRIDNNKGYVKGNIMIVSALVNVVKNNATRTELDLILKNWENLEKERSGNKCQE